MQLSPWAWTKVLRPVVAALRARGHKLNAHVDDFAATGRRGHSSSAVDATAGRREILGLFRSLRLHVHPTKGERDGTCKLPLFGFLVDTRRRKLLLPAERLTKLVSSAKSLLSAACRDARRVRHRVLQRLTGTAVSCSLAIPSARFFLRSLYNAQGGLDRAGPSDGLMAVRACGPARRRSGCARLTHGALDDLRWFSGIATEPGVGRALWQPDAGVLTTDASPYGWGGHLGRLLPAAGFFTLAEREQHINLKEVAAVRLCLQSFGRGLLQPGGLLRVRVDNRVAMHVINGFTSRSPALMAELRRLHVVVESLGVSLKASWLPSVANVWADTLSRMRDRADYRMCDAISARLDQLWGGPTIDMIASAVNTRCTRFFSRMRTPGCEGVDAFSAHWGGEDNPATYAANWVAFSRYCMRRGQCALPANTNTVVNFVGWQWRRRSVKAASLKPMLAAVRKAHLAAGFANPCDYPRVREAKAGFRQADLHLRPSCVREAAKLFSAWLLEELRLMRTVAPVGTLYASHSLKSGGATAANAAGGPRGAI
eukprot:contig_16033_g3847